MKTRYAFTLVLCMTTENLVLQGADQATQSSSDTDGCSDCCCSQPLCAVISPPPQVMVRVETQATDRPKEPEKRRPETQVGGVRRELPPEQAAKEGEVKESLSGPTYNYRFGATSASSGDFSGLSVSYAASIFSNSQNPGYAQRGDWWNFGIPTITKTGSGLSAYYTLIESASKTYLFVNPRTGTFGGTAYSCADGNWNLVLVEGFQGNAPNAFVATVYNEAGCYYEFDIDPMSPTQGQLKTVGRGEDSNAKLCGDKSSQLNVYASHKFLETGQSYYTQKWKIDWTTTIVDGSPKQAPLKVTEYITSQTATNQNPGPSDCTGGSNWAQKSVTDFTYKANNDGNQDASEGDLIEIKVTTDLSSASEKSISYTNFKYYVPLANGNDPVNGGRHQLKALINPDTSREYYIQYPNGNINADSYTTLQNGNFLDQEYEYYSVSHLTSALKLYKKTVRKGSTSCGCGGGGSAYYYTYTFYGSTTDYNTWKTQVRVDKGALNSTYAYYELNYMGDTLVFAAVDPLNINRMNVSKWKYNTTTGFLEASYFPSAIYSYVPGTHVVTTNQSDGTIYWYGYSPSSTTKIGAFVSDKSYSRGESGAHVALWNRGVAVVTHPTNYRKRYFVSSETQYQPAAVQVTYAYTPYTQDPLNMKEEIISFPQVPAAENGENAVGSITNYYDYAGRAIWSRNLAGSTTKYEYGSTNPGPSNKVQMNRLARVISDINTGTDAPPDTLHLNNTFYSADTPPSPPAPPPSPLNITTTYEYDIQGRVASAIDANSWSHRNLYTKISGGQEVVLQFPCLDVSDGSPKKGPMRISVSYQGGPIRESASAELPSTVTNSNYASCWNSAQATIALATGQAAISGIVLKSRSQYQYQQGKMVSSKRFVDPTLDNSTTIDTTLSYDTSGNLIRAKDPDDSPTLKGTITVYAYDYLNRISTISIGTDDTVQGNVKLIESRYYEGEGTSWLNRVNSGTGRGEGSVTRIVKEFDNTASANPGSNDRVVDYYYDLQNQRKLSMVVSQVKNGASATDVTTIYSYNTMGQVTTEYTYEGTVFGTLRFFKYNKFDVRGNLYESRTVAVNNGVANNNDTTGKFVSTKYFRNQLGSPIKVRSNGAPLTKTKYDGVGRVVRSTVGYDMGETEGQAGSYAQAADLALSGDTVISQSEFAYDNNGNLIISKRLDREPGNTDTGYLGHGAGGVSKARGSYTVIWYDEANRETHRSYYGNNGSNNDIQPGTLPAMQSTSDSNQILNITSYTSQDEVSAITDPQGIVTAYVYDTLGMLVSKTEDSGGTNRITQYTYNVTNQIRTITAATAGVTPGSAPQVTEYFYGVSASQSQGGVTNDINSNRMLYKIEYPRDDEGNDNNIFGYDVQGELAYKKDASGNVHKYTYKLDGSLESDQIVTLASGFDGAVRSIWRVYDGMGRLSKVTSRNGTAENTTALNGVLYTYDKYGLVNNLYQNPTGDATTGSLRSQYSYTDPTAGAHPGLRLASTNYPNTFGLIENYNTSSQNDYLNRPYGRSLSSGAFVFNNDYQGLGRVLKRHQPTPAIDWSVTLDRFARIDTLKVESLSPTYSLVNNYQYGYEYDSQVAFRKELTTTGKSEAYQYNNLKMLDLFKRGTHDSSGDIPLPTLYQRWNKVVPPDQTASLDHSGNWLDIEENAVSHTAAYNKSNEIALRDGAAFATYDLNGNMLTAWNLQYKYDAWNRLVEVRGYSPSFAYQLLAFSYNGLHQKIKKAQYYNNGKYYYYDLNNRVVEERDATIAGNPPIFIYVWGTQYIDELVARGTVSASSPNPQYWDYYFQDANFNTITRWVGNQYGSSSISRYIYKAYGAPTQLSSDWNTITSISEDLYLFTGREYQQIVGSYYYRSRFYDANLGRFLNRDLVSAWYGGCYGNKYEYVNCDPLNRTDSNGLYIDCSVDTSVGNRPCCITPTAAASLCDKIRARLQSMYLAIASQAARNARNNVDSESNGNKSPRNFNDRNGGSTLNRAQQWERTLNDLKEEAKDKENKSSHFSIVICRCDSYNGSGGCGACNRNGKKHLEGSTPKVASGGMHVMYICCDAINTGQVDRTVMHELFHATSNDYTNPSHGGTDMSEDGSDGTRDAYTYEDDFNKSYDEWSRNNPHPEEGGKWRM